MFISLSIILFINGYKANSQQVVSVDKWVEYVEEMVLETEDEERIESLYADLSYRAEHPFELNEVTAEQLRQLPFLSDPTLSIFPFSFNFDNTVEIVLLEVFNSFDNSN